MTEATAQKILQERILPLLEKGTALLPAEATGGLGALTIGEIQQRLDQHLDDSPLATKLQRLVEQSHSTNFSVTFQSMGAAPVLSAANSAEIALICQELLNNALKHAGATSVQILLVSGPATVITLADNGRGINEAPPGQGLSDLESRVNFLGGTLTHKNRKTGGAAFALTLPKEPAPSEKTRSPEAALGKKLHDGFCQELAILKMMATQLRDTTDDPDLWKNYRDATLQITQAWEETRELSHDLLAH